MSKRAKHEFLVGYPGESNVRWGTSRFTRGTCSKFEMGGTGGYANMMTARQACRAARAMPCQPAHVFRLVDATDEVMGKERSGR